MGDLREHENAIEVFVGGSREWVKMADRLPVPYQFQVEMMLAPDDDAQVQIVRRWAGFRG